MCVCVLWCGHNNWCGIPGKVRGDCVIEDGLKIFCVFFAIYNDYSRERSQPQAPRFGEHEAEMVNIGLFEEQPF